jgi:hypothetical protein
MQLQALQYVVAPHPAVLEVGINQSDIGVAFFQLPDGFGGTVGNGDYDDVTTPAREPIRDQMRAHAVRIRDKDMNASVERL